MLQIKKCLVFIFMLFLCPAIFGSGNQEKNEYPQSEITIIVPYAVNGGTDSIARIIGAAISEKLNQPVSIQNKLGGSGAVGMISGAASIPDGYTLTMVTRELVSLPAMGLAEISEKDFRLLGLINLEPAVLVVANDSSFNNIQELIIAAKRAPGNLKFASAAKPHFYILEFENREEVAFNKIPYNGAAMAIPAVVDGQADFTIANPGELKDWLARGEVRALAIMDENRLEELNNVPTLKEEGIDVLSYTWRGLAVPAETPDDICLLLEDVIRQICSEQKFIDEMKDAQYQLRYKDADDFKAFIGEDFQTIQNILKSLILQ